MDDLIHRAKRGDSDAFITLFEHHKQALWKTAIAVLDDSTDAADALQETALRSWRAIPSFEGRSSINTWLTRIILRICYDMLRKRKREVPFSPEVLTADAHASSNPDHPAFDEACILAGRHDTGDQNEAMDVRQALFALGDNDRLLLTLFYVNDYSIKQIAAILAITEGAVRTRLTRARERFRESYGTGRDDEIEVIG